MKRHANCVTHHTQFAGKGVHRYKESDFLYIDECVIVEIVFSAKIDINVID